MTTLQKTGCHYGVAVIRCFDNCWLYHIIIALRYTGLVGEGKERIFSFHKKYLKVCLVNLMEGDR